MNLHKNQSVVFRQMFHLGRCVDAVTRFGVVAASRGFGKSILGASACTTAISQLTDMPAYIPNKNVVVVAPTYSQVTDIFYPIFAYQLGLKEYAIKSSKADGIFEFPNAVTLKLVSGEAIERLRGTGIYFLLIDELPSFPMKEAAKLDMIDSILMPAIATRWSPEHAEAYGADIGQTVNPGKGLFISTTKGYDTFHDMYNYQLNDPEWKSWSFDYTTSPYISRAEVEKAALKMDPIKFNREYRAVFAESGSHVFYMFAPVMSSYGHCNIIPEGSVEVHPEEILHIAIDFNIMKQHSSVWIIRGPYAICVAELAGSADTAQLCAAIRGRFVNERRHPDRIFCYPDPTGRSKKTSATIGTTDFTIIAQHGFVIRARSTSPGIIDSVAAVNAKLRCADNPFTNKPGFATMFVMAHCKGVIKSLMRTSWVDRNPDSAMIDKSQDLEHYGDGVRYFTEYNWPIAQQSIAVRGTRF